MTNTMTGTTLVYLGSTPPAQDASHHQDEHPIFNKVISIDIILPRLHHDCILVRGVDPMYTSIPLMHDPSILWCKARCRAVV